MFQNKCHFLSACKYATFVSFLQPSPVYHLAELEEGVGDAGDTDDDGNAHQRHTDELTGDVVGLGEREIGYQHYESPVQVDIRNRLARYLHRIRPDSGHTCRHDDIAEQLSSLFFVRSYYGYYLV